MDDNVAANWPDLRERWLRAATDAADVRDMPAPPQQTETPCPEEPPAPVIESRPETPVSRPGR
jgi:hypothetical protein